MEKLDFTKFLVNLVLNEQTLISVLRSPGKIHRSRQSDSTRGHSLTRQVLPLVKVSPDVFSFFFSSSCYHTKGTTCVRLGTVSPKSPSVFQYGTKERTCHYHSISVNSCQYQLISVNTCVHLGVVHRPEPVKHQVLFIPAISQLYMAIVS